MKKYDKWLVPVLILIIASILSMFLTVLTYVYPDGRQVAFNIDDFVEQSDELVDILAAYSGPTMYIDKVWLTVLAFLAAAAIVAAFAGVVTMSRQRPNTWQFVMALAGVIGTAIPAIIVIVAAPLSQRYLPGAFRFGVYPIVTPIAMAVCMITVTKKHKKTQAEIRAEERAKGLIYPGGDL